MKKGIAVLLTAVMCIAALTACGSKPAEGGTPDSAQQAAETGASQASDAGSREQASGDGTNATVLRVGTNAEFPPFEYVGDDGEPDGFDIALIKAIGEKMGMEVTVENMEFGSLVSSIGTKIDLAIAGMTIEEDRKQSVDFSNPYFTAIQNVIALTDSDIATAAQAGTATAADLENKKIGVQMGTTGATIADEVPGATVQEYNKAVDAVNDLINGRLDLVIIDQNPAKVFAEKFSGQVTALEGEQFDFIAEDYAIALPKGDAALVEKVNQALAELKADGTFDALVLEYIGQGE